MNEQIKKILQHPATIPVAAGVMAFGAGFASGFFLGRGKKAKLYVVPDFVEPDFEGEKGINPDFVVEDEAISSDGDTFVLPAEVMKAGSSFVQDVLARSSSDTPVQPPPEVVRQSVFAADSKEWDYEEELDSRSEDAPYVIHKDEYFDNEHGFSQTTLTYYAGDDILADETEVPVYNHDQVVGELKFGHGSGDANVFYVRNEKLQAEYEILRHEGRYAVEVQGLDDSELTERVRDIRHSRFKD